MHLLIGGPGRAPHVILAYEEQKKNFKFSRCILVFDMVLKYGSDINERNWLQLLFYFILLIGIITAVIEIRFFQLCFMF